MASKSQEELLKTFIEFVNTEFKDMQKSVTSILEENTGLSNKVSHLEKRLSLQEGLITQLQVKIAAQEEEIIDLKCRSMRDNLVIYGIEENGTREDDREAEEGTDTKEESWSQTKAKVVAFLKNKMKIPDADQLPIDRAHRMGPKGNKPRPIVVKFLVSSEKDRVFGYVKNLKGLSQYSVQQQFPAEVNERRKRLWPKYKAARDAKENPKWALDKLIINGRRICANDDNIQFDPTEDCKKEVAIVHTEHQTIEGSTFIGHAATIKSNTDIPAVLASLLQDRSIAQATHNAYAYRIGRLGSNNMKEGIKDDGEHGAGMVILKKLQESNVTNTIVVVSRFYGGKHMGARRFDCFKNCTDDVLKLLR
jgi:regulator of replication initiation timing